MAAEAACIPDLRTAWVRSTMTEAKIQALVVLTQNLHLTPSIQQAEQASFTREKIPRRASQFSLKINKRQSS
jgi:hypothetical protein